MLLREVGAPSPLDPHLSVQALAAFTSLEPAAAWALAQRPPLEIDVVTQDEFTHDVIVPITATLVLVFDTT